MMYVSKIITFLIYELEKIKGNFVERLLLHLSIIQTNYSRSVLRQKNELYKSG